MDPVSRIPVSIVVDNREDEIAIAHFEFYEVVLLVRVIALVEVGKRGDLMQCGRFDHFGQLRNACRE